MHIRLATEQDLGPLLEIYNDIILNTTAVYDYEPHTLAMRKTWWTAKEQAGLPVFVAEVDGVIGGFSSFGPFRAWAAYRYTVENSVYVGASMRGRGLGKALLEPLIDSARSRGLHAMVASIDATNEVSLRLHRSFGFEEVAHFKEVGFKFGRWLDLKFLELRL